MIRALLAILTILAVSAPAAAQPLDGTWLLFADPADAELARLEAAGGLLPAEQLAAQRRIVFEGSAATVHAGEATIRMTVTPTETEWGVDAQVSGLEGSAAPVTFLRIERISPDRGTLTSYTGQTPLESFAILRVRPQG
ncbi:MAG: hypothetical protein ACFCVH_02550 [Alphaproteobacteria bacterium]